MTKGIKQIKTNRSKQGYDLYKSLSNDKTIVLLWTLVVINAIFGGNELNLLTLLVLQY